MHRMPRFRRWARLAREEYALSPRTPQRPETGTARPGAGHPDAFQNGDELRAVTTLTCGDQQKQPPLTLLAGQMDLGGEASPGPAQAVVVRLGTGPGRRFLLSLPVATGARGVLMGPADRVVDGDLSRDHPGHIRPSLQPSQQSGPGAVTLPEAKESVDRLPRPVLQR
ncbi:hypothetical protein ScoT_16510 [Streptomyces albidoflavus]|uniref:Uncharacterized protein n=1 Tax=Streptomyces albidoflavus TaxID=1886 RepID=A0AA37BVJ2_9ACTN|nr:hypothetical protein ScoT_16510 [Streptomyces albidoflavus]